MTDHCPRCEGCLIQVPAIDMARGTHFQQLRCLNCGHRFDAVSLLNAKSPLPQMKSSKNNHNSVSQIRIPTTVRVLLRDRQSH